MTIFQDAKYALPGSNAFPSGRAYIIVALFPPLLEQRIRSISNLRLLASAVDGAPTDSAADLVVAVSVCCTWKQQR